MKAGNIILTAVLMAVASVSNAAVIDFDELSGNQYWYIDDLAQGWVSGTIANRGLMLRSVDESATSGYKQFRSSSYGTAIQRPKLIVNYYDPAP